MYVSKIGLEESLNIKTESSENEKCERGISAAKNTNSHSVLIKIKHTLLVNKWILGKPGGYKDQTQ